MKRSCDVCGEAYEAQRSTSKYCSTRCRTRACRAGGGSSKPATRVRLVAVGTADVAEPAVGTADVIAPPTLDGTYRSTVETLQKADRLNTPLGQAAIRLAYRIDNNYRDTGSAAAGLVRQFQDTLVRATADVKGQASPLDRTKDQLAQRRARRGA